MGRFSRIFAQDKDEQEEELQPMYEHLDGTVEVLGFEQYRISAEAFESSTNEIEEMSDSLEADIVLLETISRQQRDVNRQDSGINPPNYQGLEVDEQKISLSDDSKKVFMEKGIDYRKVVSSEGLVDKVKEIWEWIVDKIKSWWDKLWGNDSSSTAEKNKKDVKELKNNKVNGAVSDKLMEQMAKKVKNFDFNKWASFLLSKPKQLGGREIVEELFEVHENANRHLDSGRKLDELMNDIHNLIKNQLLPIGNGLVSGTITKEDADKLFGDYHTHMKANLNKVTEDAGDGTLGLTAFSLENALIFTEKEDGSYEIKTEKSEFLELSQKVAAQDLYKGAIEFFDKIGKETFVKKFEHFVRSADDLIKTAQKSRDNYVAIGKQLDEVNKKIEKGLKDPKDFYPAVQTQFSRSMNDIMKITSFIKNEIILLEEFTAAFINLCQGYVYKGTQAGGAIKDPHANWEVKKQSNEN